RGLREHAVRGQLLPRLPRSPRPRRATHGGAGGVLAPPRPRGADLRRRLDDGRPGPGRRQRVLQARLPRGPVLARLRRLPERRGPGEDRRAPRPEPHRRRALRGGPAPPGAVHGRAGGPPPGGQVLQCLTSPRARTSVPDLAAVLWDMDGTLVDSEGLW